MSENAKTFVGTMFGPKTCFGQTENGAKTYLSTGSKLVDQFGLAGNYRGREIDDVFKEQAEIWEENAAAALRFPFYLRMVTRKTKIDTNKKTENVQNGQGARDESFKRFLWIAANSPESFYKNLWLLPIIGSWKDFWTLMFYDVKLKTNIFNDENRKKIYGLMFSALEHELHVDLVKKFMPRIKSSSKCTTEWTNVTNRLAKEFANYMGLKYSEYNKLKANGKAHDFQKLICAGRYNEINWDHIPGRALSILVGGKFLDNHNLRENYEDWLNEKPVAKFTGYVYELLRKYRNTPKSNKTLKRTVDKQFQGLVEQARKDGKITDNVLCALDTSGSMSANVSGLKGVTCSDIATSLALFFAELNQGAFHKKVMMFDNVSRAYSLPSDSFTDNVESLPRVPCGGTNFQSVIDEMINIRKRNPNIPLDEYPTTILAVSDMHFNPTKTYSMSIPDRGQVKTNMEEAKAKLKSVFPADYVDNITFIWWNCASRGRTFEGTKEDLGALYFSGFDGSIISMLMGEEAKVVDERTGEKRTISPEEMVIKALSQEILNYIDV